MHAEGRCDEWLDRYGKRLGYAGLEAELSGGDEGQAGKGDGDGDGDEDGAAVIHDGV